MVQGDAGTATAGSRVRVCTENRKTGACRLGSGSIGIEYAEQTKRFQRRRPLILFEQANRR